MLPKNIIFIFALLFKHADATSDKVPIYIGCFADQLDRTLPYYLLSNSSMTTEMCLDNCCSASSDSTYMGTESGYQCFCGNMTDISRFVPRSGDSDQRCDYPCLGNVSQICGGGWTLSIYKIECLQPRTTDPSHQTDMTTLTGKLTCECPCGMPDFDGENGPGQDIEARIISLISAVSVNKKATTLYMNTKRSASDDRISSRNIGIVGMIVILFPVFLIFGNDILNTVQQYKAQRCEKGENTKF